MQARASFLPSEGIPGASDEHAPTQLSNRLVILIILAKSCSRRSESFVFGGPGSPGDRPRSPFWHPWVTFPEHWGVLGPPRRPGELPGGTLGSSGVPPGDHFGVLPALPEAGLCHYLLHFRRVGPRGGFCSTGGARNPVDICDTCGTWPSHTPFTDSRGHPILCVFATHSTLPLGASPSSKFAPFQSYAYLLHFPSPKALG